MAKYQTLKDEEIVRIARGKVTESAAATFTEVAIDTQLSIERGVIWMIHCIEFSLMQGHLFNEIAAGASETYNLQLTRESQTAILTYENPDVIQSYKITSGRSTAIGTDAGPLWTIIDLPKVFKYVPPLPYASQSIYFGVLGTFAVASTATVRVRYTIRTVSDKYFFRVAQALLG